ncbi:MAG: HEAT repeat domain-containing protein [Deltaproteobacteria bacterium]|nr:HEAT repeat domain-containing protein [Deltaproteobacteria bacterium]
MRCLTLLPLLLPLASAAEGPQLLDASARAQLQDSLRLQGATLGDLSSADRDIDGLHSWLADSLSDPLAAPELAHRLTSTVALDAAATPDAHWDGVLGVAAEAWGVTPKTPDCAPGQGGTPLSTQHIAASEAQGNRWSKRERNDLAQRLNPELDRILGGLADAAARAACGMDLALKEVDPDARPALAAEAERLLGQVTFDDGAAADVVSAWESVNKAALLGTARAWLQSVDTAAQSLAGLDDGAWPASPLIWRIELGEVWIGSPGANSGAGDPVLLVDPGGDDHWRVRTGKSSAGEGLMPVRGWIDLGGDDVWRSGALGPGGAAFGVSAGVDLAGDDVHEGGSLAAGAGLFGVGAWLDVAGRDRYDVGQGGEGFGVAGLGVLRDRRRDDIYRADRWAQGAALPGGIGVLHDLRGGDRYLLTDDVREERDVAFEERPAALLPECHAGCGQGFAAGLDGLADGGTGLLVDDEGGDVYSAGEQAQGASRGRALGVARDGSGDDRWLVERYGQAAADAQGVAVLIDRSGVDEYLARSSAQGWAEDRSVAWLVESRGQDTYSAESKAQGATRGRSAVGAVLDLDGGAFSRHAHAARGPRRPSLGVITGGAPTTVRGALLARMTRSSSQADVIKMLETVTGDDERGLLARRTDLLHSPQRAPAEREQLVRAVVASAERLIETDAPRHHLEWLGNLTRTSPLLAAELEALAGALVGHASWRVREAAWHARYRLSAVSDLTLAPEEALRIATDAAVALQKETHADVRAAAARAAGAFGGAEVAGSLTPGLLTEHLGLRRSSETALLAVASRTDGVGIARGLFDAVEDTGLDAVVREAVTRVLGATGHKDAVEVLVPILNGDDAGLALAAAEGLARHGSRAASKALAPWLEAHPDKAEWATRLLEEGAR